MKKPENSEYKYIFYIINVGHLIISNKSRAKNIITYISNSLNIEYYFQKICEWRQILKLFIIQMSITPKVFGLEKRNCTFWKWRSFSFKMMSRICRIKVIDYTDKNVSIFFAESVFWSVKSVIFIRYIRDAHHFKAEALPFPKSTVTFF